MLLLRKYKVFFLIMFLINCSSTNTTVGTNMTVDTNNLKYNPNVVKSCTSQWPYFWKIEKDGKISYALGSMHITVSLNELPCASYIKSRLINSDLLFSEISNVWDNVLKEEKSIETDSELNHLYIQNGFELAYDEDGSDFLQLSQSTQRFFRENNVSNTLSHTGYSIARTLLCFIKAYGHSIVQKSIDRELVDIAKSLGIPIKPLDTIELRRKMNKLNTFATVEEKVRYFSYCPDDVAPLSNEYKSGNAPLFEFTDDVAKVVLKDRNEEWLDKFISDQRNNGSIFIVAGLAHFNNSYNLLDMLRNEGFTISSGF